MADSKAWTSLFQDSSIYGYFWMKVLHAQRGLVPLQRAA